ncbi:CGNR zinc finger domain-containing protein [Leifsonia sp. NPDC077715]|uniref:CGNR zinc finger domain-containing protein n=1 Tax=Leifsonia sp. NPDC077715 TaxID=3155539 RepID=UPI00343DC8B5
MIENEERLLAVLNSAPVVDGHVVETLDDPRMIRVRDRLQAVIRGDADVETLTPYVNGVKRRPTLTPRGITWELEAPADGAEYAGLVLEWARLQEELPGRLRPCANPECTKFLIDHSKPNTARWCSMATCGNRMKARRHYARRSAQNA